MKSREKPELEVSVMGAASFFAVLIRHGTIKKAAYSLDVSAASVYQRITYVEERLGFKIFDKRRLNGLIPTKEAKDILDLMILSEKAFLQFKHA